MKKAMLVILSAILLGGCTPKDLFVKAPSGLEITSNPQSTVFLNGESKGETPYKNKELKPGTYTIKLVPVSSDPLEPYETNITLVSKASTIINRDFAPVSLDSSGYTLTLQEELSGETFLSVISDPDTVNVTLDDKPSGFTPLSKIAISPGSHTLQVVTPGYDAQTLPIITVKGYNLIINFKLASQNITLAPPPVSTTSASTAPPSSPSPSPSASLATTPVSSSSSTKATTIAKPYVLIGETGTGWLRIRKEASGTSGELGKANTGETLKYLGESTELGWHKIEFEGQTGWVSGKYVTLVK